jgi:hypothetical protein
MSGIENQLSGLNRAFSAAFMDDRIPGALPQAKAHIAPSALKTSVTLCATYFGNSSPKTFPVRFTDKFGKLSVGAKSGNSTESR